MRTPWFFSRSRTRLAFSFFFTPKNFFLFPLGGDSRYFYLLLLTRVFLFFPIPWILVDIRLVNIYIYIYYLFPRFWWLFQVLPLRVFTLSLSCCITFSRSIIVIIISSSSSSSSRSSSSCCCSILILFSIPMPFSVVLIFFNSNISFHFFYHFFSRPFFCDRFFHRKSFLKHVFFSLSSICHFSFRALIS